jgi:hypothetical protein
MKRLLVSSFLFLVAGLAVAQEPCYSTTMDGLPNCPMAKMTARECLSTFPPDRVGGFCEWYGYVTKKQADRFEARRGFVRYKPRDGSGDLWRRWPSARNSKLETRNSPAVR